MRAVVDIGNTRIKIGFFIENQLIITHVVDSWQIAAEIILQEKNIVTCMIGNVRARRDDIELKSYLETKWQHTDKKVYHITTGATDSPIINKYASPHSLGADRLAGAVAAHYLFPDNNCLFITLGTCITYNFITKKREYLGGAISPGLAMRFNAMHQLTDKRLPLISPPYTSITLIGNDTQTSMQSGVINGMAAEIDGIIRQYTENFEKIIIIMAGGDVKLFESMLKHNIFAEPYLVLKGLNYMLNYILEYQK
jgi:type III pantothenate kinase